MDAEGNYLMVDGTGAELGKGETRIVLAGDGLELRPRSGPYRLLPLRDIVNVANANYQVDVLMRDGRRLRLSALGRRYEDLVREIHRSRNDLIMRDLLMEEKLRKPGVKAELRPFRGADGPCEIRLYETAMVIIPLRHGLMRVRYSDIEGIESRDHILRMVLSSGELLALTMLGREMEPLWNAISNAMAEMSRETQDVIRSAYPQADGRTLEAAAALLKEGRAATRWEIEDISPDLWKGLEDEVKARGLAFEYAYLTSRGRKDMVRIGIKRSLMDDVYIWFAIPILGPQGNAVAVEATSSDNSGRATYFFRIAPRSSYHTMDEESRESLAAACMDTITSGLRELNFRRQPIYLTDEQLRVEPWSRYRFSVMLIPELRNLRARFIGRVPHAGEEAWKDKVEKLLAFNAAAKDDSDSWHDADELEEEVEGQ
ncbi:MAG TPA: hypothetical protein PKX44_02950 [Methanomassiliicoccaceae archaeon]|nr:hypothetical protein [Methanomassiliicoccaceae archaeon]